MNQTRICAEQNCNVPTSKKQWLLCHHHYDQYKRGLLFRCLRHTKIYISAGENAACTLCARENRRPTDYGTRICAEENCWTKTAAPNYFLCRIHWDDQREGIINKCRRHPEIYKPARQQFCRQCTDPEKNKAIPAAMNKPGDGWGLLPDLAPADKMEQAVRIIRRNLERHNEECAQHEANTIQYLVDPIIAGAGWDEHDPEQVIREYKIGASKAADIALMRQGSPAALIEVKRLDLNFAPEYERQLRKYAAGKDSAAILTNGRHWRIYRTEGREVRAIDVIDITEGSPEEAAKAIGKYLNRKNVTNPPAGGKGTEKGMLRNLFRRFS